MLPLGAIIVCVNKPVQYCRPRGRQTCSAAFLANIHIHSYHAVRMRTISFFAHMSLKAEY